MLPRPRFALSAFLFAASAALATEPFPKEAELLKDVKVADGFDVTLFSAPPQSNYPVFISAAPDGTLYVSSDGNGSLDRKPNRGRILRLRDTDGDGRADEVKEFVKDVDSPRGLVVDGNTVYCVHPPHLSAFIDKDGDGVADEEKVLVKNLAFTFKDRPADHTTNGLELGIDGWLYIAGGDFGFMEAEGTDGRKLQLRGGGIIRVRPDGTNLQLYSRGTRNILEAAVSPLCDIFSRDNTNDGGGWDIRFHHFTGFEDHGYPRLFKSFGDEIIQPLADYGGGSGMGACWIDEPTWPAAWNNLPYTADWGKGPVFRHTVQPKGATYVETEKPKELVRMTRSTDIDVDAQGYAYVSSWRGATFTWEGPNVGYIVRLAPKGMTPAKVPDFAKASESDLVKLLESPSHRTRLAAQRTLLQRAVAQGRDHATFYGALFDLAKNPNAKLESRIAALYTQEQLMHDSAQFSTGSVRVWRTEVLKLTHDEKLAPWALRALSEESRPWTELVENSALTSPDARVRREAVSAIARGLGLQGAVPDGAPANRFADEQFGKELLDAVPAQSARLAPLLGDADPVVAHTAMQVLRQLSASDACFAILDNPASATPLRDGALMTLRGIHDAKTVDGLIARLAKTTDATQRQGLLTALCRLFYTEGKWKGDSWGTRPDTRGPYYQPEEWAESKKISALLKGLLNTANNDEAVYLAKEFSRHRIKLNDAIEKLLALGQQDVTVLPILVKQLAERDSIPAAAMPLLLKLAADAKAAEDTQVATVQALAKTDGRDSAKAILEILARLGGDARNKARDTFFNSRLIENQHQALEEIAAKADGKPARWADAALLKLAARKIGAPEPREMAGKALDAGWAEPKRRVQIIKAAIDSDDKSREKQIATALSDPDKDVAEAAKDAVKRLKLDPAKLLAVKPPDPVLGGQKVENILIQLSAIKGDITRGEQLFTQAGCVACHTVKESDPPKGPFLGNIAATYKRAELAEAILLPNKSIAQGFVTNVFTMKDGSVQMGFVTQEAADKVVIRNIAAQEITLDPKNIVKREKIDKSLMPEGLLNTLTLRDLASLVDYFEALAKKK